MTSAEEGEFFITNSRFPVLSLSIAIVFLLFLPRRLHQLLRRPRKVFTTWQARAKACVSLLVALLLLATLIECLDDASTTTGFFPCLAVAVSFVAALAVFWLSFAEHRRSIQPSNLIISYLATSLICDSLWILYPGPSIHKLGRPFTRLFIIQTCLKLVLFLLECRGKESALSPLYRNDSPEETAGLIRSALFWWVNAILADGSKKTLQTQNLPSVPRSLSSTILRGKILRAWDQRAKPEGKRTLPLVLLRCLAGPFSSAIVPRLFLTAFRYGQPILIRQAIRFVSQQHRDDDSNTLGFWILVSACSVYTGMAISTGVYEHKLNTLRVMARGALVNLIYSRLLNARSDAYETGAAITLMSTDTDGISLAPEMFHELWGHALEVGVGTAMLYSQVGWLWFVPLLFIFCCSHISRYVAKNLKSRQRNWVEATQQRVAAIASVLGSMKSVKALGLSPVVMSQIRDSRIHEIAMANKIRWMMVVYNASANALGIFTPPLVVILYAMISGPRGFGTLDAETAFTTVAILTMVTHPANMVMTIVPRVIACSASFERVQSYLLRATREDHRILSSSRASPASTSLGFAIRLQEVTVGIRSGSRPVLENVSLDIKQGWIAICCGPVGSGKSILARTILGEVPLEAGTVKVASKRIGYCSQTPWLPEGTVREVICAFAPEGNPDRYEQAIRVCCLDHDLSSLPDGDRTVVGSRGMNLSGGQRQRVALARLVYTRCDIAILDNIFSSLDRNTASKVIQNLLGQKGLFRQEKTTVFWIDNHSPFFRFADHIIILGNSTVANQGPWHAMDPKSRHDEGVPVHGELVSQAPLDAQLGAGVDTQKLKMNDAAADLRRKTGDLSLYELYFRHAGIANSFLVVLCTASYSLFITFPHYWLKWWVETENDRPWRYMIGYILLTGIAWASTCGTLWATLILVAAKSGSTFHQILLETIIRAPLSFFSTTDTGITLNRFSQDMALIDSELPMAASSFSTQVFKLLVQVALLFTVQKFMLFTLPPCLAIISVIQKKYLQTSRQLRFIDLESRSGMFSSFLETVEGVVTIRAFGWQSRMDAQTTARVDLSQKAFYTLFCLQRWLNVVIDLMMAGIAVGTITLAVVLRDSTTGGDIGVALSVVLVANTTLLRLVQTWTTFETSLGAIARMKAVQHDTPVEDLPGECLVPAANWPSDGAIEIRNLTASYGPSKIALDDITLTIPAGQKLVICGRTGSGKSTFILSLTHMVEYTGTIKVDGLDISQVSRSVVRERCLITIPQDAFIMPSASLRSNIDPTHSVQDDEFLVGTLKRVKLWDNLNSSCHDGCQTAADVLDATLASLPVLSDGQAQLLALARALVKREAMTLGEDAGDASGITGNGNNENNQMKRPVLVLDEATSSLDPATEAIIHDVIDDEFVANGHTVIMVTHRPATLVERMRKGTDAFALMRDGRLERVVGVEEVDGVFEGYSD